MTTGAKILVVDDNEQNRALARDTLEEEGFQVLEAIDGVKAVAAFAAERPDCILMDVRMPGLDGFGASEQIRALPGGRETPILFLTALRDLDTFDAAQRAGADDFLTKPVRPTELMVRVRAALRLRQVSLELRETYELVRSQRDTLMRMQLQKERLISFVVHDLKNPVNTLDLHAQLLLRDRALSSSAHETAARMRQDVRAMMRLILNLLDISKAEEGQLTPRLTDVTLPALVGEVIDELRTRAEERGVSLESSVEVASLRADPDLLRRLLENLSENALRHAPPRSAVRLLAAPTGGWVEVRVADAGSGVPAELREKIFDKFVQVDHEGSGVNQAGRGLGLTFCKMVVEAHGGTIHVEDGGPGAIFCARFPSV